MDTLIKFDLRVRNYNKNKFENNTKYLNLKQDNNEYIFTINEYEDANIIFYNEDSNVEISIDVYDREEKYICKNKEEVEITKKNNDFDISLVPGIYEIKILLKKENKEKIVFFKVEPKNLTFKTLINLTDILNKRFNGICKDFNRKIENVENRKNFIIDFDKQIEILKDIKNLLFDIVKNPYSELKRIYTYGRFEKKINGTTIRKNINSPKSTVENKYYSYNNTVCYDTETNDILLNEINKAMNTIKNLKNTDMILNLKNTEQSYLNKYESQLKKANEIYNNYRNRKDSYILSEGYRKSIEGRKNYLYKMVESQKKKVHQINDIDNKSNKTKQILEEIIVYTNKLEKLSKKRNFKVINGNVRDKRYRNLIIKLRNIEFLNLDNKDKKNNNIGFRNKKTATLFEYISLLKVFEVLEFLDFECTGGWFKDAMNMMYCTSVSPESVSYFLKEDIRLEVFYDKEFPKTDELKYTKDYEGLVSLNSKHRRPDITILMYEKNQFKRALILEMKCRNTRYIHTKDGRTEVSETLYDYIQLGYKESKNSFIKRGMVNKVAVIYPNQENNIINTDEMKMEGIKYIPISCGDEDISQEILDTILEFIYS